MSNPRQPMVPAASAMPADRVLESREQPSRKHIYRPPGQLPELKSNPDWTGRWIRVRLKAGIDDIANKGKAMRDNYAPVPWEQRGDVLVDPDSVFPSSSGNIEVGDLALFRRDREISRARKVYYEEYTAEQIRGARHKVKEFEHPNADRYGKISDSSTSSFQTPQRQANDLD